MSVLRAVQDYTAKGYRVVPIAPRSKRPLYAGWPDLRLTMDELPAYFGSDENLGVLNGEPSGGLIDIDLDAPEVLRVANEFLPETKLVFGRKSKLRSHRLYQCTGTIPKTAKYQDVDKTTLIELRSTGSQTVWPPSVHPSGERIAFETNAAGNPAMVDAHELQRAVSQTAAAALLARHWPLAAGGRHDLALAAAGFFLHGGLSQELTARLIGAAAGGADDDEVADRVRAVRDTASAIATGKSATGGPRLVHLLGEAVVERLVQWLELDSVNSVNSVTWGTPVDFNAPVYGPPVPLEAFPPAIALYVEEVAASYQVPADLVAAAVLGVLAAAAAHRAVVAIGETHHEPLNLYVAPTAASGERKQFLRALAAPLEREQARLVEEARPGIALRKQERVTAEKRIERLQKQAVNEEDPVKHKKLIAEAAELEQELPVVPPYPQLLFDDTTPEFIAKALAEQGGRAAIVSEEAGSLFEVLAGRYTKNGVSSLDVHLKAYDGGTIDFGRISRDRVHVERPALTIVVTPQPHILDQLTERPEFRERGLIARFVFTLSPSLVGTRFYRNRPISPDARADYERAIARVLALPLPSANGPAACTLKIVGVALDVWKQFADETELALREGKELAGIPDWGNKHPGRVARIAGLFHLIEASAEAEEISVETVAAAWVVGQWLQGHALAAFSRMGAPADQRLARRILDWIRRHRLERFTLRDLHQHHRTVDRPNDLLPVLELLVGRGFLHPLPKAPKREPGRPPSPTFLVNPATHSQNSQNSQNPTAASTDRDGSTEADEPVEEAAP